jgi:site-specific DNA-cytosine methylase
VETGTKFLNEVNKIEKMYPTPMARTTRQLGSERQQTWWQTQSELCGVPNGVSYELDKNRTNRIKALGNSIVPQIARELGLAILESENDR